jgi:hypothetical protein
MEVAYVNRTGTFCCVDFNKPELPMKGGNTVWRIGTSKTNLTLKKEKHPATGEIRERKET